jgi:hypothetical protein
LYCLAANLTLPVDSFKILHLTVYDRYFLRKVQVEAASYESVMNSVRSLFSQFSSLIQMQKAKLAMTYVITSFASN